MNTITARARPDWPRLLFTGVLVAAATILLVGLVSAFGSEKLAFDFRAAYLPAADAVRGGDSPYPRSTSPSVEEGTAYVYPPQVALALVPLTYLSRDVAALLAFLLALAALAGALAVVGVRDIRCYAALLLWAPAWNVLEMANVSALLALALAVAWRFRDRVAQPAVALGLAISAKLVLWPLLVWTAARGRYGVTGLAVLVGAAITFLSWGAIGFAGLEGYPDLLERLSDAQAGSSYSLVGVAEAAGLGQSVGHVLAAVLGFALVVACVISARRGDELRSFAWAICTGLALSPILWQHYLVLLAVPLAVARPRFSLVWLAPALLWLSPRAGHGDGIEPFLPMLVAASLVAVVVARPTARGGVSEAV